MERCCGVYLRSTTNAVLSPTIDVAPSCGELRRRCQLNPNRDVPSKYYQWNKGVDAGAVGTAALLLL